MTAPKLRRHLLLGAAAPAGFLVVAAVGIAVAPHHPHSSKGQTPAALAPTSPAAALLEEHDCWTGEAPADMAGQVPGHVVVTLPGRDEPTYGGRALTEAALDQVFGEAEHDLTVWGFCR